MVRLRSVMDKDNKTKRNGKESVETVHAFVSEFMAEVERLCETMRKSNVV